MARRRRSTEPEQQPPPARGCGDRFTHAPHVFETAVRRFSCPGIVAASATVRASAAAMTHHRRDDTNAATSDASADGPAVSLTRFDDIPTPL